MNGIIKRLPINKRFGFIRGEGGIEYFFHEDDSIGVPFSELREGDKVKFDGQSDGPKGPRASKVERV